MGSRELLKEGDVIELERGHDVYTDIPMHFVYSNHKGDWSLTRHEVNIGGEFGFLVGRYIVTHTVVDGGGSGHGANDYYPNGHHVFCKREDGREVDFYQTGCFTAMVREIDPVGKAKLTWAEEQAE